MHNAITWFEIPTPHIARAQAFYEAVLDRSGPMGLQPALVLGAAMGNQNVTSIR